MPATIAPRTFQEQLRSLPVAWPDQNPPATDVILHVNVPCAGGSPAYLEIHKLADGTYRKP